MSILSYIVSTILLSLVGAVIYLAFRQARPGLAARRGMIWLTLAVSLVLPLTPPFMQTGTTTHTEVHAHPKAQTVISPIPVGTESLQEFCSCSDPHAGDVVLYQASRAYDFLLSNRLTILLIFGIIGGLLVLRMAIRLGRLYRITRRDKGRLVTVDGQEVRMVGGMGRLAAGSVAFFGKYIFWNKQLDQLPVWEREAILLHELSHLRQRNTLEKVVLGLIQTIWFLNPAYYFFTRELELLSEYTADRFAAGRSGDAKAYAHLLLRMKTTPAYAPVQFFRGSKLRRRVKHVLAKGKKPCVPVLPALILGLVLLFPGEVLAQNLLRKQIRDIEVYEFLSKQNKETGNREFCKKCTYEAVEQACY